MLCRKMIYEGAGYIDWRHDLRAGYGSRMMLKYQFSSQVVAWSELYILEKSMNLAIRFKESENVNIQVGEKRFSEVVRICFCNEKISYITTRDGSMHHFLDDEFYATTPME
ncbi:hypothetical protein NO1_1301 [Candidatus Termititenax aidoneus]|uniref:Uncharacterized protein n=1 Tax=Termititenax aidoneus TaxID=2218524 RepID=A0A388TCC8_TERA1|nr:hypothetical protein NO1_1301 [Candidatus Termititenax aidoneus]